MSTASAELQTDGRAARIRAAGWAIILLSAGSAALPAVGAKNGAMIIGGLLVLAGAIELFAGTQRHETRKLAMLAGALTIAAGLLFSTDPATKFLPILTIIMGWLFLRSLTLAAAAALERGSVRRWTALAAATDLLLSMILAVGLSISTVVVALFGTTPPLIASFAWILAISFVASGLLLLEVADCGASEDV